MTIDEYADLEAANGAKLRRDNGVWWKEVRPFFYRPLYPFARMEPYAKRSVRPNSFLGGFQHLVTDSHSCNSHMNFIVLDKIHEYSLDALSHNYRKNIKKGSRYFAVKKVDDINEFVSGGYAVYLSFYNRTGYFWKKERTELIKFMQWAENLYRFQKLLILGAYYNGELSAISISYLVEDTIIYATFFCKSECLQMRASELMLHTIRTMASECKYAKSIFMGMPLNRKGVNDFKISRGCNIISEPAYLKINPLVYHLSRLFRKEIYLKLVGMNQEELTSYLNQHKNQSVVDSR